LGFCINIFCINVDPALGRDELKNIFFIFYLKNSNYSNKVN